MKEDKYPDKRLFSLTIGLVNVGQHYAKSAKLQFAREQLIRLTIVSQNFAAVLAANLSASDSMTSHQGGGRSRTLMPSDRYPQEDSRKMPHLPRPARTGDSKLPINQPVVATACTRWNESTAVFVSFSH